MKTGVNNERGIAVVIALLTMVLLGALAAALVTLTTIETLVSASFRRSLEVAHGAEAALERGLHDLATMPDWSPALSAPPANVTSSFDDGETTPRAPDGRLLDLTGLTADRQRASDARAGPAIFGANGPEWRLFAHAPLRALLAEPGPALPLYLAVWIADDESDGDGNPALDSNGRILVWSVAFGSGGTRGAIEARIERASGGALRLLSWRQAR
jgi:hypothetical protein